ncbi:uncharacterized protein LOC108101365 isoform X2 [Drosophila ficusphila]|uniref:uncharacterized protein LOC108101365 isoform X2 n=1 Tax=Drosophila ficusphila TaxID=30025 RepID=UPI0007E67650|nr:uncharacterized protein LOC108101365 isoform X2 [Drosophila ficusphila]
MISQHMYATLLDTLVFDFLHMALVRIFRILLDNLAFVNTRIPILGLDSSATFVLYSLRTFKREDFNILTLLEIPAKTHYLPKGTNWRLIKMFTTIIINVHLKQILNSFCLGSPLCNLAGMPWTGHIMVN